MRFETIHSVKDYLSKLESINSKYKKSTVRCWDAFPDEPETLNFIYRGISNHLYTLCPRALNDKLCHVAQQSYDSPIRRFQKESSSYLKNICGNDMLLWMQYAQHFGVPTRLLDFSNNPLVALFFSCSNDLVDGVVWILNVDTYEFLTMHEYMLEHDLDKFSHEEYLNMVLNSKKNSKLMPVYIIPEYIDNRMSAQCSRFMLWPRYGFDFEDKIKNHYMSLDSKKDENEDKLSEYAIKFIVPKEHKAKLLQELDMLGINEKILFPGLDGIGRYIDYLYKPSKK